MSNINAKVIEVRHADLERYNPEDSAYKSECPECEDGVLLVLRDRSTGELLEYDRCIGCGQLVRYLDIEKLKGCEQHGG